MQRRQGHIGPEPVVQHLFTHVGPNLVPVSSLIDLNVLMPDVQVGLISPLVVP